MKTWKILSLVMAIMLVFAVAAMADCDHATTVTYVTEGICEGAGYTITACTTCGTELASTGTARLEHDYMAIEIVSSTCTTGGHIVWECQRMVGVNDKKCGHTYTEDLSPNGHTYVEVKWVEPHLNTSKEPAFKDCAIDGYMLYKCEKCNVTGSITSETTAKDLKDFLDEKHPGMTPAKLAAKAHVYDDDDWEVTTKPTCCIEGVKERKCHECNADYTKKTASVDTVAHALETVVVNNATCFVDGLEETRCMFESCPKCWDAETKTSKYVITKVTPKLDHDYQVTSTVPATCTEDGVKNLRCVVCKEETPEVIPAAHAWTEWEAIDETTEARTCKVCNKIETKKIAAEEPAPAESEEPAPSTKPSTPGSQGGSATKPATSTSGVTIPATGDTSIAWVYMMMAAAVIVLAVAMKRRALNK